MAWGPGCEPGAHTPPCASGPAGVVGSGLGSRIGLYSGEGSGLGSGVGFDSCEAGGQRLSAGAVLAAGALVLASAALSAWLSPGLHRALAVAALRCALQPCALCLTCCFSTKGVWVRRRCWAWTCVTLVVQTQCSSIQTSSVARQWLMLC